MFLEHLLYVQHSDRKRSCILPQGPLSIRLSQSIIFTPQIRSVAPTAVIVSFT